MLKEWLMLHYLASVPLSTKRVLIKRFLHPVEIFSASRHSLSKAKLNETVIQAILSQKGQLDYKAVLDLKLLRKLGGNYLPFNAPKFPTLLNCIPSPPLGLFTRGDTSLLQYPQIAIVGSRNASTGGLRTTVNMAQELSSSGFTITSGMASGIDYAAHHGALKAKGNTIAVMGTGIDQIYPKSSAPLYQALIKKGLIVSEFFPGAPPRKSHFPERNRIISGLSVGTLVVEAGLKSGSLITARLAGDQGREVFAIPGSIHMPTSRGCHFLIKSGAKLVESVQDIYEELGHLLALKPKTMSKKVVHSNNINKNPLYKLIDFAPKSLDILLQETNFTTDKLSALLLELELAGSIEETPLGYIKLPETN